MAAILPYGSGLEDIVATEEAFRRWYDSALPRVYGYLLARCGGDPALAEELAQVAFSEGLQHRGRFEGRADPTTWICAIARHKLADHYRKLDREERRHQRLVVREIALDRGTDFHRPEQRQQILDALKRVHALQRAALVLRYMDGLSVRDVARELSRSESATESLLSRAREAFREAYEEADHG